MTWVIQAILSFLASTGYQRHATIITDSRQVITVMHKLITD